jgi:glycosyltransferase involved in cell wall biosynthesis
MLQFKIMLQFKGRIARMDISEEGSASRNEFHVNDKDIKIQNSAIRELIKILSIRDKTISLLKNENVKFLQQAKANASYLEENLKGRDDQITALSSLLQQANSQTAALRKQASQLQEIIKDREDGISSISKQLEQANERIAQLQQGLLDREKQIAEMRESIIWQMTMKFHNDVVERLTGKHTKRRECYDLCLKTGRKLVNNGPKNFFTDINEILRMNYYSYKMRGNDLDYKRKSINDNTIKPKRILIIDYTVPKYDQDSGSLRLYNMLKILSNIGHVTFIANDLDYEESYASDLRNIGVRLIDLREGDSIADYLTHHNDEFNVIILCRYVVAIQYIDLVKKHYQNAKIIFDTVDLHFLREKRRAEIENNSDLLSKSQRIKDKELSVAKKSDVTIVVSSVEKDILLREVPGLNVKIVSNICDIKSINRTFSDRADLLFIGGFKHLPNIDAVTYFVENIFPTIKKDLSGIKFFIVGSHPPPEIQNLSSSDIIVTGYVKNLDQYFERCRLFVAPLRYGAGVKGKINQSCSYGLPVVTTSIGVEGMYLDHEEDIIVADAPEMFVREVIRLYRDEALWNKLSKNSLEKMRINYSFETAKRELNEIMYH